VSLPVTDWMRRFTRPRRSEGEVGLRAALEERVAMLV
jgi:hypothetical protein